MDFVSQMEKLPTSSEVCQLPVTAERSNRPQVVILGGGFGGLAATKTFRRASVDVTVIDQRNYHLFQPLLYQVATAALSPGDIAVPIRRILRKQGNASTLLAEVVSVDAKGKRVIFAHGTMSYDYLIVATGTTHSYFGHPEWAEAAPGLKTIEDALEIRKRILLAFECAEWETNPTRQRAWLTFVIVGGGPTGVELAGAIAEIARHVMPLDFRRITPAKARVLLIEGGPRLIPSFPSELSQRAAEALSRLGVEVVTGQNVTALDDGGITVKDERVEAFTILWAAGVAGSPLGSSLGVPLEPGGRVPVQPDLSLAGSQCLFIIGDLAALKQNGEPLPGLAPVAVQEGRHAAKNILRHIQGLPGLPFTYRSRGTLATIGRAAAVAEVAGLKFSGFLAWLLWLLVHIVWLIGFRNRFLVVAEWAWIYLRYDRGARLITGPLERAYKERL